MAVKTKSAPKKATPGSASPRKAASKKATPKKAPAKKAPAKKAPVKKTATKKKKPAPVAAGGNGSPAAVGRKGLPGGTATPSAGGGNGTLATAAPPFIVEGTGTGNPLFTLRLYRGEGMVLLAMNWAKGQKPPANFVGFAIEFMEPGGTQFFALTNRLSFLQNDGNVNPNILSTRLSPIQKFRWVHFPHQAGLPGNYTYRVTPVFMDATDKLNYGDFLQGAIQLSADTYPGKLNIGFTRGFVASQAFVNEFGTNGGVGTIIPQSGDAGLTFTPTDPNASKALDWMGFEARQIVLHALDQAIADSSAEVRVTAYDCNEPEVVNRLVKLGARLKIIIDDSGTHGRPDSPESKAAATLTSSAGAANVQRQHVGGLQHNKTIAIHGNQVSLAIGGSTNFSWRGFFVQNNNAVMAHGPAAAQLFFDQFDNLFNNKNNPAGFAATASADWNDLGLDGIKAKVSFSPHNAGNARLAGIAADISASTSSLLYSLAFLFQEPGPIQDAIKTVTANNNMFVYGLSDKTVGGLDLQRPNGNPPIAFPAALLTNVPEPFKTEATGGSGVRMHHKFVVIDFDKPTAMVYTGSHNFSSSADLKNGENLFLIQDQRVAVSYMIEAVTMFDHYEFRDAEAKAPTGKLFLKKPPATAADKPWWDEDYTNAAKARDRLIFAGNGGM